MSKLIESIKKMEVVGNVVKLPKEMLPNYPAVKKAMLNAGGKYKSNTFVFDNDPQPMLDHILRGDSVNIKQEFQFFETPKTVIEDMYKMVEDHFGGGDISNQFLQILEPSAGTGNILDYLVEKGHEKYCMVGAELMPENILVLKEKGYEVNHSDFILAVSQIKFDIVMMNPPFTNNQDIKHVRHAYGMLKPGGILVSIMSPHFTFASEKESTEFKSFVDDNGTWLELPEDSFKESGTKIRTVMVTLRK